ncbi:MAG TPA: FdtA/QdtA family cupin domain-containing protein [Alphaproteobacteria bacterium]
MTPPVLITLQTVPDDARGFLSIAQMDSHLPFVVKRYFTMTGMHKGMVRGNHAHRAQSQFFNALNGVFELVVEGHMGMQTFKLDHPGQALNVPPLHWVTITSLEDNGILLVCASDLYDSSDYICDHTEFKTLL